jgi:hypothetical protein
MWLGDLHMEPLPGGGHHAPSWRLFMTLHAGCHAYLKNHNSPRLLNGQPCELDSLLDEFSKSFWKKTEYI